MDDELVLLKQLAAAQRTIVDQQAVIAAQDHMVQALVDLVETYKNLVDIHDKAKHEDHHTR